MPTFETKDIETCTMYDIQNNSSGSYYCITGESGNIVLLHDREEQVFSFDPCSVKLGFRELCEPETLVELIPAALAHREGRRRKPYNWEYYTRPTTYLFNRGFTGHCLSRYAVIGKHLDLFGIINMNGRLYDPWLGRFLSPDNFVQSATYSQNFNRYSYVLNNPLKYTDPSGEIINFVIGGIMGGIQGYMIGQAAGLDGWALVGTTLAGAAIGAGTAGIGTAISGAVSGAGGVLLAGSTAGAAGMSSFNTLSAIANGGDFNDITGAFANGVWQGTVTGLAGSAVGGAIGGGWGAFAGSATAGGVGAALNGGDAGDIIQSTAIGGVLGLGVYHANLAYSYHNSGIKSTGLKYNQYARMIRVTQRSMFWNREGYMTIDNTGKIATGLGEEHKSKHTVSKKTVFDYHTHQSLGNTLKDGDGFSFGVTSDETTRMQLIQKGFKHDMYLGTREGHFHYSRHIHL